MLRFAPLLLVFAGWNDSMPPTEYRGEAYGTVFFLTAENVHKLCAKAIAAPPGVAVYVCAGEKDGNAIMILPDPCPYGDAGERFAEIACHEKAHLNGWSHD